MAISLYADDSNVTVRSGSIKLTLNKLNSAMKMLEPAFEKWRIYINVTTFLIILFSKRRNHYRINPPSIKPFHTHMNWTNQVKHHVITLDSKLTYRYHASKSPCEANHKLR